MIFFPLTSASELNHVPSTSQKNCDSSIGDTAATDFGSPQTAECIDRYQADGVVLCSGSKLPELRSTAA